MTVREFEELYHSVRSDSKNGRYKTRTEDGGYTEVVLDLKEGRIYSYTYSAFGEQVVKERKIKLGA